MQHNNPHGNSLNPNMPPGGGYGASQQPMGYYPGQQAVGQGQPQMMAGGGTSIGYQTNVPLIQQQQPQQQHPMMQQAMYGAQGVMATVNRPTYPVSSGFHGSGSLPMGIPSGGQQVGIMTNSQGQQQQYQPGSSTGNQPQYMGHVPSQSQMGYQQNSAVPTITPSSTTQVPLYSSQSGSHVSSNVHNITKTETKKALQPPPYSSEILDNLEKYSVGTLTMIGREIVSELNSRTHNLCQSLKAVSERKHPSPGQDPDLLLEYCQRLMDKLVEIRLRIEKKVPNKRLTADEYIMKMCDQSDYVEDIPLKLEDKHRIFEENRNLLISINNDLKMLDWMASVSDPGQLKKVDKMASSVRE